MADDQENVKITFDTNAGKAAVEVNKLGDSLDNVEGGAKAAGSSMKSLDATFEDVYGDLKPLTARMGEAEDRLYELALAGKTATAEYQDLLTVVANYRRTQIQTDQVVDAAATTLGQKLGGAAQLATSAISAGTSGLALFGAASEDTEKALLKVQAAMAFADSISSLSDLQGQFTVFKDLVVSGYQKILVARQAEIAATTQATIAQRLLNITALANPYVALAAAVAAITVVTYAWVKSSNEEAKSLKIASDAVSLNKVETDKLTESIEKASEVTDGYNSLEVARAKALGASDVEIQKIIQSQKELAVSTAFAFNKEAYNNLLKATEAARAARKTGDEELIKDAQENQKAAHDLYNKSNEDFNKAIVDEGVSRLEAQGENLQKQRDADQKALDERKRMQEEAHKSEQELIRARGEAARAAYEKEVTDFEEFKAKLIEAKILGDIDEAERVQENLDKITQGEDERLLERTAQEQKIYEYRLELKKELRDREYDIALSGIALASSIFGKSKGVQKAALIAESAVGVGKTVRDTFTGNAAALAQGIIQAGPILGPGLAAPAITLNSIQGGLSVAGNIAATAKALQAVGGGSAPSPGVGAGGAAAQGFAPPSVQFNNTAENQIGQSIAQSQANQPPITVNVLESDITNAQDNVKALVETNTF